MGYSKGMLFDDNGKGFNQLLVNSRGTIINMINSAVNEKGRQAII